MGWMSVASAWHVQLYGAAPNAPVRWRLLSANNRDMGRGSGYFDDAEACRLAVKQLQADAGELMARVRRVSPSKWEWEIVLRGVTVASRERLSSSSTSLRHLSAKTSCCPARADGALLHEPRTSPVHRAAAASTA